MRRFEVVVTGDPDLVLESLRMALSDGRADSFELDAGLVPGTRYVQGQITGRFERVAEGVRIVGEAGSNRTTAIATGLVAGAVVVFLLMQAEGGVKNALVAAVTSVFVLGVLFVVYQWSDAKAAEHSRARLDDRLAEVRVLIDMVKPPA